MSAPRSLADDLRQRDDASLRNLLRRRPDLLHPVPPDFTALTARATAGPSVARCLDRLDALHLHVLRSAAEVTTETAAPADAIAAQATADLDPAAAPFCEAALADLRELALIWGSEDQLRAVHPVRALVATTPLPIWPAPTAGDGESHDPAAVDAQAAVHAREFLAQTRDLLDDWSIDPPGILRSGGLALRDFASARARLHADWATTALTIELTHAARLLADDREESPHWVPTDHFDAWQSMDPAYQWAELVAAWLVMPRLPSIADEKTQLLTAERDRLAIPVLRREVLDLLAALPPGSTIKPERILAVLDDHQPRRSGELRRLTVTSTLREAASLGVSAAGALSSAGRLLLEPTQGTAAARGAQAIRVAAALREALPDDIDHVLIQADLTIVAPGPLVAGVARSLRLIADVESRGHATVFRVSENSVRQALDAGWDAESIHAFLREVASTSVPQPLTYLIDDVARRHGVVRVGSAFAYVRSDNPEALSAMVADRRLRELGLSRIADTVVVSQAPTHEVIAELRSAGYAPAAESADGVVVVRRPEDRRTLAPRSASVTSRRPPEDALVNAAVRSLRAGDQAAARRRTGTVVGPAGRVDLPKLSAALIVSALRSALADNRPVWVGYADTDGTVVQQIVDPIRLSGGVLTAYDHRTDTVRPFSVSRVTGVAELEETDDPSV